MVINLAQSNRVFGVLGGRGLDGLARLFRRRI
jgi:hypothetical protein